MNVNLNCVICLLILLQYNVIRQSINYKICSPLRPQEVRLPRVLDNRNMKVAT